MQDLDPLPALRLDNATPDEIAAARLLIEDKELRERLGAAARAHAQEKFDPVRNARTVESVYDELLGLEPAPPPALEPKPEPDPAAAQDGTRRVRGSRTLRTARRIEARIRRPVDALRRPWFRGSAAFATRRARPGRPL